MKEKEKQPLLLIYYKLKDEISLTEQEQRIWNAFRNKYPSPTGKTIDPEDLNRIVRWPKSVDLPEITVKQSRILMATKVAASIILLIVTAWLLVSRPAHTSAAVPRWDILATPRGQQATFTLPDGSTVYLNAASKLRYPLSFTAKERAIELLEGEIWLQVNKDTARPFVVHCQGQQVKVLGTRFNIKAYPNSADAAIITTLEEGTIQITHNNQRALLKPGQSCFNRQGQLSILVDSLSDVRAWRNSFFTFHNKRLADIMEEVKRWYDVEMIYRDPLQDLPFTIIDLPRKAPIDDLLDDLAASRLVRFRKEGRKVYVSK